MKKNSTFYLLLISCFFSVNAQNIDHEPCLPSSWEWAKAVASEDSYGNTDIFASADGNVYVIGSFTNNILVEGTVYESKGNADIYLLKYNPDGQLLWTKVVGGKGVDEAVAVVSDNSGNVYVTGTFLDTLAVENRQVINLNNSPDIFLIKFNAQGNLIWLKHYGGNGYDHPGDLVVDQEGALYLSGGFEGSAEIGGTVINSATEGNSFLLKLSPAGERVWLTQFGDVAPTNIKLAVKSTNNIIVGGDFSNSLNIQTKTLNGGSQTAAFVAEFSSNGTIIWLKKATDGEASSSLSALSVDDTDAIYIGGSFISVYENEAFQIDDSYYTGSGGFLAKFTAKGAADWSTRLTSAPFNYVSDIAIDPHNNVFASGLLTATLDFGGEDYDGFGGFVAKYDPHGVALKLWETGSFSYERINLITADLQGNIYCTGVFEENINFGSTNLTVEEGYNDAFVAKLNASRPILAHEPDRKAGNITFSKTSASSVDIFWDSGNGKGRLVVMRELEKAHVGSIVDGHIYDAGNGVFGKGSQTGRNQFIVYNGSGNTATITGIEPNKTYSVAVIEYNTEACSGTINYKTDRYASAYLEAKAFRTFHNNFQVYPNPVENEMNIILHTPYRGKRSFKLMDQQGRLVHNITADVTEEVTHLSIDLDKYKMRPGTYFLKINDKSMKHGTYRILKK